MKKNKILLTLSLVCFLVSCGNHQKDQICSSNNGCGVGIDSIVLTSSEGNVDVYTITYTDDTTSTFKITNGKDGVQGIQGEPGEDGVTPIIEVGDNGNWIINEVDTGISASGSKGENGNGIAKIELTSSNENIDTYTIFFTNGDTSTFNVINGKDGVQGIQGEPGEDGRTPVIKVGDNGNWFIDGVDSGVKAIGLDGSTPYIGDNGNWWINGEDTGKTAIGQTGTDGRGIEKIELTGSEGETDTYTIFFTDGTTTSFTITNGEKGEQGSEGLPGKDGKSAYEIFKEYHPEYEKSEEEWINDVINGVFSIKVKITFDANGGILTDGNSIEIEKGKAIGDAIPLPTKKGKKFLGRYTGRTVNDEKITKNSPIYTDLNLVAMWDTYDVEFLNYDGTVFESFNVDHGKTVEVPTSIPSRPTDENHSYDFVSWDFNFSKEIFHDTKIHPIWNEREPAYTFELGLYPQSVVYDKAIKSNLSLLENGTTSGAILNYDSDSDGVMEKYICQETKNEFTAKNGKIVNVGLNYFKFEPIEWLVLHRPSGQYLVTSKYVLDLKFWNRNSYKEENGSSIIDVYNDYSQSEIRYRLNNNFYNLAFSEEEKGKIVTATVENGLYSTLDIENKFACEDTEDKVFLLSRKEIRQYFFAVDTEADVRKKIAKGTDFAKAVIEDEKVAEIEEYDGYSRWTRTPDPGYSIGARYIRNDGDMSNYYSRYCNSRLGVRPAMYVKL